MKKQDYLDLMEIVISAYSSDDVKSYTEEVEKRGIYEHGFPRLTANLGILISHGKASRYKEIFLKMMNLCCKEIPTIIKKNGGAVGNDFSVKETVFCLLEIERAKIFDKTVTDEWRRGLSEINPYSTYTAIASKMIARGERVHNWAAFSAASEQVRKYASFDVDGAFIDEQIVSQLVHFDENGMYCDPNEPMLYDFMTRLQLAAVLYFGYSGKYAENLKRVLLKSSDITLDMQSATGEIPFGGRSAQFLYNEACYAALCEFYADYFKKCGNMQKAGEFKSAALLAANSIVPWLEKKKISHIKNCYDVHCEFGCEDYAYFDKYMITTASCLYMAYIMADEYVEPADCPAVTGKSCICCTSELFHKIMCRCGDYFIETETRADPHYDANGLGRVHRKNAPPAICLSVPFAKEPNYRINSHNLAPLSIAARIKTDNGYASASDSSTVYKLTEKICSEDSAFVKFVCKTEQGIIVEQRYTVSEKGVWIDACGSGRIEILFPVFEFDGEVHIKKTVTEKSVVSLYGGWQCTYETDGKIECENKIYENRNGRYTGFFAFGENKVSLNISIDKQNKNRRKYVM